MAEARSPQPSITSRFLLNWNFDGFQAADNAMFVDCESELSEGLSLASSMEIDIDPFDHDFANPDAKSYPKPGDFSVQYLLPLEVNVLMTILICFC